MRLTLQPGKHPRFRALVAFVSLSASIANAGPPLPPDSSDFSLSDLEQRNAEQAKANVEAEARWKEWQARMTADFERMMKLNASAEIASEAASRFLAAYAANNPYSVDDDRMRGIAYRRRDAGKIGGIEVEVELTQLTYERPPVLAYPSISMRLRETGEVVLRAVIEPDGLILYVSIEKSSGYPRLDSAARNALASSRFKPIAWAKSNTRFSVLIPFSFKLE